MKKNFSKLLVCLLSLSLASCGGNEEGGVTKLSFFSWGNETETKLNEELVNQFNEIHRGEIEVKFTPVPSGDYETKIGYEILTELQQNKDYHCAIYLLFIRHNLLIDKQISFLETAYCSEDMLFTYQLFCSAQTAAYCKIIPYHRRYHAGSIVTSAKSHRHFRSCRDVYRKIRDFSEAISIISDRTAREYIARCAFNVFNVYEKLSKADKKSCKEELREFKNNVLENNAFGNTALKMRCYGKIFWFIYKIYEKTVGRLLKGKK